MTTTAAAEQTASAKAKPEANTKAPRKMARQPGTTPKVEGKAKAKGQVEEKRTYTVGEVKNRSALESPVQVVRALVDANPDLPGKEIVAMAVAQGISLNTARTQVSVWRKKLAATAAA